MTVALIAAQSENRVIGNGPDIPWHVKGEQALFRKLTMGGVLIMGRTTFESIGRPLPGRQTIIVTRNTDYQIEGCYVSHTVAAAIEQAGQLGDRIFVAGGGQLYEQTIGKAHAIHLTTIHTIAEGDVLFPELPTSFRLVSEEYFESNINYTYRYYEHT